MEVTGHSAGGGTTQGQNRTNGNRMIQQGRRGTNRKGAQKGQEPDSPATET